MATNVNYGIRDYKLSTVSAAKTVEAAESGTTFLLDAAGGAAVTLPSLAPGLNYKFIVAAAFASTDWVISSAEGDNINGIIVVNGASVPASGEDNITFAAAAESIGDVVEFVADYDNSQWLVWGISNAASSVTANDPA